MNIAIIIPTYNEKENVKRIVPAIFSVLQRVSVIVVDDHSPDGTAHAVRELGKKYSRLHIIERKGKGGRGSAVIEGFRYARKKLKPDIYIEMDADLSHDASELPRMISLSKPGVVVFASRYVRGGKIVGVSFYRRCMSRFSNFLIRMLLGLPGADNTNGYRCYRPDAIELLLNHRFISTGYILLSESAFVLYTHGFSFIEFPSIFRNRKFGLSNASIAEFMHALKMITRIRSYVSGV